MDFLLPNPNPMLFAIAGKVQRIDTHCPVVGAGFGYARIVRKLMRVQ